MKFSFFLFFLLSALAVASSVSETNFVEERGLVLESRAPRGGSRGRSRARTGVSRTRKTRTRKKTPKKTTPKKTPKKTTLKKNPKKTTSKKTPKKNPKKGPKKNPNKKNPKKGPKKNPNKKNPKKGPKKNPNKKNPKKRDTYICGAKNSSCGSKRPKKGSKTRSCPIGGGKKKKTTRAIAPVLTRRTLDTVSNANLYVVKESDKHRATQLDYNFPTGHVYAVSKSGTWGNRPQTIPLTGLEGCTGIAVVSEKGYWISHFMEVAMDPEQSDHKVMWNHLINDVTHGRSGKYTPPHEYKDIFDAAANPKIYISRPKRGVKALYTADIHKILAQIRKGLLSNAPIAQEFEYHKMYEKEIKTLGDTTARGKMLLEYTNDQKRDDKTQSPQQAMYRIWLEDHQHPVSWAALDNQKGTSSGEDENKVTRPEFTKHCLSDAAKTIPEAESDQILAAVCDKPSLDLSSPISKTHGDIQILLGMSANQKGCHPASASGKKLPRHGCKKAVIEALTKCPNPAGGFLGNKPLVWNAKGLGCVDISVHK